MLFRQVHDWRLAPVEDERQPRPLAVREVGDLHVLVPPNRGVQRPEVEQRSLARRVAETLHHDGLDAVFEFGVGVLLAHVLADEQHVRLVAAEPDREAKRGVRLVSELVDETPDVGVHVLQVVGNLVEFLVQVLLWFLWGVHHVVGRTETGSEYNSC